MVCFNLAIEMLVISGQKEQQREWDKLEFQSRNRDACHFRLYEETADIYILKESFNLAIEMLVISGWNRFFFSIDIQKFQSRNRDACHFRAREQAHARATKEFQSRNRDACHFRTRRDGRR